MTSTHRLSAVPEIPVDDAVQILRAAVREEFSGPVLRPPADHPVLTSGVCAASGCGLLADARGWVCVGHNAMFYRQARRELPLTRQQWLSSNPPQLKTYIRSVRGCLVDWCHFGAESRELCARHAQLWRMTGRPAIAEFAVTVPVKERVIANAVICQVRDCQLWVIPTRPYCRGHQVRYRRQVKAGKPVTPESFQLWLDNLGDHHLSVGHLPERLRLEVQYATQTYADRGITLLHLSKWNAPVTFLAQAGVHSILDRSVSQWVASWDADYRPRTVRGFFAWAHDEVDKLLVGVGWDSEYPRDVWRVKRISAHPTSRAVLDFGRIPQPWLRDLVKRWARHRLSIGLTVSCAYSGLHAVTDLARHLENTGPAGASPTDLKREHIERWLAQLRVDKPPEQIARCINEAAVFLRDVHQNRWEPLLSPQVVVTVSDRFRTKVIRSPRGLSEYVMRQMETQLDQIGQPDTRLITEIMMRTGLRGMDTRELAFDCLVHDDKGHPSVLQPQDAAHRPHAARR